MRYTTQHIMRCGQNQLHLAASVGAFAVSLAAATVAPASPRVCHPYRGRINAGPALGEAFFPVANVSACESACIAAGQRCYAFTFTPPPPAAAAVETSGSSNNTCSFFNNSNIGSGANLPTVTPLPSPGACCDLCSLTPACLSWTWAADTPTSQSAPCWLHPSGTDPEPAQQGWISGVQHVHPVQAVCTLWIAGPPGSSGCNTQTNETSGLCSG
jgi:hypothetical protein